MLHHMFRMQDIDATTLNPSNHYVICLLSLAIVMLYDEQTYRICHAIRHRNDSEILLKGIAHCITTQLDTCTWVKLHENVDWSYKSL